MTRTTENIAFFISALVLLTLAIYTGFPSEYLPIILSGLAAFLFFLARENPTANTLFAVTLSFFLFLLLSKLKNVLFPFGLGLLIAFLLSPLVDRLEKYRIPRVLTSIFILTVFLGLISLIGFYVGHQFSKELSIFSQKLPGFLSNVRTQALEKFSKYGELRKIFENLPDIGTIAGEFLKRLPSFYKSAALVASYIFYFVLSIIVTFYTLNDYKKIKARTFEMFARSARAQGVFLEIAEILRKYFRGQLIDAFVVGLLTAALLGIMGIDFFIIIGVFAGLFNLVPTLGFWLSYLIGIMLGFMEPNPLSGFLKVTFVFIIVQLLESTVISPRIIGGSVGLHPLIILVSLLIGAKFFGPLGFLLAVPVAAILKGLLFKKNVA